MTADDPQGVSLEVEAPVAPEPPTPWVPVPPAEPEHDGHAPDEAIESGSTAAVAEASQEPRTGVEGDVPVPPAEPSEEDDRHRRRRIAVLALLGGLALLLLVFSGWYLLFRKPVTEMFPPITTYTPPGYSLALYGLDHPHGIAVTRDGSRIYVTQGAGSQATLVLDAGGTRLGTLAPPQDVNASPSQLYVAVDPVSGDVYASDRAAGALYVYGADGTFMRKFDPGLLADTWQPLGLGFDTKGDLYVTDVGGAYHVVHEFGPDGALMRDLGTPGQLNFPNGVTTDSAGDIYITDSNNGRVVVLGPDGAQRAVVRRGQGTGDLGLPRGVAIDDAGRVYVVDSTASQVEVYRALSATSATALDYLGEFGVQGAGDGAFQYPNGTAVDGRGRIYIADWANDRVQLWSY